jgi:phosphoribosyl 1,2-cyclic phosphate phosphodiesterase
MMKVVFLGTGTSQGVPVVACDCRVCRSTDLKDQRLRASVLIETGGKVFVIDAGPDFRQQMLREQVKKLDAILITHEHKDHIGGLDDVRAFNFIQRKAAEVYAGKSVLPVVLREFDYAFGEDKYPGVPEINLHEVGAEPFLVDGISIIPVSAMHHELPVLGFRIGDFAYLTDLSHISPGETEKLAGTRILVVGALRKKVHHSHMNLAQAIELIDSIKPEKAYLTHISHLMGCHAEVENELPSHVSLAFDRLTLSV